MSSADKMRPLGESRNDGTKTTENGKKSTENTERGCWFVMGEIGSSGAELGREPTAGILLIPSQQLCLSYPIVSDKR